MPGTVCDEHLDAETAKLAVEAALPYRVGDPLAEGVTLGPLASKMQQDRVREYIAKGIAEGCELGKYGLEDFLEYKAMQFRPAPKP